MLDPMTAAIATPPTTVSPLPRRPLRVLALPAFNPRANPYNRLLYQGVVEGGAEVEDYNWTTALTQRWDVIHVHWPEYMLRSRNYAWLSGARRWANLAVLRLAKQRGAKLVWTVHNLKPHGLPTDAPWQPFADFLELVDGCFFLSADSRRLFEQRYPAAKGMPGFVVPHGVFDGVYPTGTTRGEARRRLGIPPSAIVAASVGGVEPYKNLVSLVREHERLDSKELWVVIAGRVKDARLERELRAAAAKRDDVQLHLKFIADEDLQHYFTAADFCVAPYSDILNSGAVLLALSFGRPVLCPAVGSMVELQRAVGDDWLMTYEGGFTAAALAEAAEWSQLPRPARPHMPEMAWGRLADQTINAYQSLLAGTAAPNP